MCQKIAAFFSMSFLLFFVLFLLIFNDIYFCKVKYLLFFSSAFFPFLNKKDQKQETLLKILFYSLTLSCLIYKKKIFIILSQTKILLCFFFPYFHFWAKSVSNIFYSDSNLIGQLLTVITYDRFFPFFSTVPLADWCT